MAASLDKKMGTVSAKVRDSSLELFRIVLMLMIISSRYVMNSYVTYGFGTTVDGWLMHVMMAVSGSIAILWIARRLPHQAWLCYLGRQSLIVYMTQRASLLFLLSAFAAVLNNGAITTSLVTICVIAIATCSIAVVVAHLIGSTPLRVIMGRSFIRKAL